MVTESYSIDFTRVNQINDIKITLSAPSCGYVARYKNNDYSTNKTFIISDSLIKFTSNELFEKIDENNYVFIIVNNDQYSIR